MDNLIIIAILVCVIIIAVRGSVKHFKGEGGCCGGGYSKPRKKKLSNPILRTYIIKIEGMHCQNCADNVIRCINDIDGAAARVSLKKHEARILCDRDVDMETIKNAIERRGYKAVE